MRTPSEILAREKTTGGHRAARSINQVRSDDTARLTPAVKTPAETTMQTEPPATKTRVTKEMLMTVSITMMSEPAAMAKSMMTLSSVPAPTAVAMGPTRTEPGLLDIRRMRAVQHDICSNQRCCLHRCGDEKWRQSQRYDHQCVFDCSHQEISNFVFRYSCLSQR